MQILLAEEREIDLEYDKAFAAMVELSKKRDEAEATFYRIDDVMAEARTTLDSVAIKHKEAKAKMCDINEDFWDDKLYFETGIEFRRAMKRQQIFCLKKGICVTTTDFEPKKPF